MRYEFSTSLNRGVRIFGFLICMAITAVLAIHSAISGQTPIAIIFTLICSIGFFEIKKLVVDNRTLVLLDDSMEYTVVVGSQEQQQNIPYTEIQEIRKYRWGAPFFVVLKNGDEIFFSYNFKLNYSNLSDEDKKRIAVIGGSTYLRNIIFVKAVLQSKIGNEPK